MFSRVFPALDCTYIHTIVWLVAVLVGCRVVLFAGGKEATDVDVEDFDSLSDDDPEPEASVVTHFVRTTVSQEGRLNDRSST